MTGLVLAGSAEFKTKLNTSELFDPRLAAIVTKVVDVSYGGENGFNQAIELSAEAYTLTAQQFVFLNSRWWGGGGRGLEFFHTKLLHFYSLSNVKFIREMKLLAAYFGEISRDTGKFCFGVADTLHALEAGAVEELIVWESLDITRYSLKNKETGEEMIKHMTETQAADQNAFQTPEGVELEVVDQISLLEWFANNFKDFGAKLSFVTNRSQEGSQFCKGFGGIGGTNSMWLSYSFLYLYYSDRIFPDTPNRNHLECSSASLPTGLRCYGWARRRRRVLGWWFGWFWALKGQRNCNSRLDR